MVVYKKISIIGVIAFVVFLASFVPTFAAGGSVAIDDRPYKLVQGFVSEESAGAFKLNEHLQVFILFDTKFFSSEEVLLDQKSLKGHKWVYVEGPVNSYGNVEAEYIYLLPGIIDRSERHKYPFMKVH